MDPLKTETVHLVPQDGGQIPSAGIVIIFLRISLVGGILKISFKQNLQFLNLIFFLYYWYLGVTSKKSDYLKALTIQVGGWSTPYQKN